MFKVQELGITVKKYWFELLVTTKRKAWPRYLPDVLHNKDSVAEIHHVLLR